MEEKINKNFMEENNMEQIKQFKFSVDENSFIKHMSDPQIDS